MILKTYKIKNKPIIFSKPVKKNIKEFCKQELFLIVANTEKYYILRNDIKLLEVLKKDFIYNNKQITYLINNIDLI